jgi:hypothetical protein
MPVAVLFAIDAVAIVLVAYVIYFRRHQRRDMLLAFVALNVGVLAVAAALDRGSAGAGLGLGLFGVLSIIRLRSFELTHEEVAYFFVSLCMGLLAGVQIDPDWAGPALIGALVAVVFIADHPRLLSRHRHQNVTLDTACPDEGELRVRLEALLGATVTQVTIRKLDLVHDTTTVDVRSRLPAEPR